MKLTIEDWKDIWKAVAGRIEEKKDYLSELDRAVGDGDHGVTMSMGWKAIVEKLNSREHEDCGTVCKETAMAFLNAVGSSVGPLYATAFLRGASALQGKTELTEDDVIHFWNAAIEGIQERGKARVGDKTMIDAWVPAMQSMQQARSEGQDLLTCLQQAAAASEEGMNSTSGLVSKLGRSSRLGERSVGHIDPGAASAHYILSAFTEAVAVKR